MKNRRSELKIKFELPNSGQFGLTPNIFGRFVPCNSWNKTGYEPTSNGLSYPKNSLVWRNGELCHTDFDFCGYKINNLNAVL